MDELTLRAAADTVRDKLLLDDHITQVELTGVKDYEIQVEISQATLRRFGITLADAADAIAAASVELGGGSLKTEGGDILVRVKDRRDDASQYAQLPLLTQTDGAQLLLGDVATVQEGLEDSNTWAEFNGHPAVMIEIYREGDQTPTEVVGAGMAVLAELNRTLPEGLTLTVLEDHSEIFSQRAELLTKNAFQGLILVFIFLALFLETRLAFWVSLGIPISFLGSFVFLSATDFSINMISMFAFIVTLGIVVDDAVVVGENIYHWRRKGLPPLQAAVVGTREVALPVVFSVLTNLVAFLPLMFVPGFMGKIFKVIPLVVIAVFGVSLIESLFILPAHLGHSRRREAVWPLNHLEYWQARFSEAFERFVHLRYGVFLALMVRQRYAVLAFGLALMLALGGYVASGLLAIPFRSYAQPLIIMFSIPFGIIGSILGHILMGYALSLNSIFGVVALSGVVVNDSLVLIDLANRNAASGMAKKDAVLSAGIQRFRPILLTTVTTFGGLMPMITETSFQARMMIPMAISLGFGVVFATLITLAMVPALYLIVDDLSRLIHRRHASEPLHPVEASQTSLIGHP